jgi:hypothetical protein
MSRFTGRAHEHEGKLIELIVLLSWRWDLPIVLYPGAPPQYRSGVSQLPTSQPLKQGYIATVYNYLCLRVAVKLRIAHLQGDTFALTQRLAYSSKAFVGIPVYRARLKLSQ